MTMTQWRPWPAFLSLVACGTPIAHVAPPAASSEGAPGSAAVQGGKQDEAWFASRHGTCAAPLPSKRRPSFPSRVYLNLAREDHPHVPDDATLEERAYAEKLKAARGELEACVREGEVVDGWVAATQTGAGFAPYCTDASEETLACVRAHLPSPEGPGRIGIGVSRPKPEQADKPRAGLFRKNELRAQISSRVHEIRSCYEDGLRVWGEFSGSIPVTFEIAPGGEVQAAQEETGTSAEIPPEVRCCILSKVRSWTFSSPMQCGVVVVSYPFVLELGGDANGE